MTSLTKSGKIKAEQSEHQTERWGDCCEEINPIYKPFQRHADWKDLVMIKLCACAAGVMWGLALPKKLHKAAAFTVTALFTATYLPEIMKFFKVNRL